MRALCEKDHGTTSIHTLTVKPKHEAEAEGVCAILYHVGSMGMTDEVSDPFKALLSRELVSFILVASSMTLSSFVLFLVF